MTSAEFKIYAAALATFIVAGIIIRIAGELAKDLFERRRNRDRYQPRRIVTRVPIDHRTELDQWKQALADSNARVVDLVKQLKAARQLAKLAAADPTNPMRRPALPPATTTPTTRLNAVPALQSGAITTELAAVQPHQHRRPARRRPVLEG